MKKNSKNLMSILLVMIVISAAVAGCLDINKGYAGKRQYVLDVQRAEQSSSEGTAVLKVRRFTVSSRFEGTGLVYRTSEVNYESDFYNEFLTSPASLITDETKQWLSDTGIFAGVVDSGSRAAAKLILEANIWALYGDYSNKQKPQAVLEIQFVLIGTAASDDSIVFQKTYRLTRPLPTNTPATLIEGLNDCLEEILKTLENDLRKVVLSTP